MRVEYLYAFRKKMPSAQQVSEIVLSVLAASTAILTVFVVVGTPVEKQVVQEQTEFVISDILKDTTILGDARIPLQKYAATLAPPDMSHEDGLSAASNTSLLSRAAGMLVAALAAGLFFVRWLSIRSGFSMGPVLRKAMVSGLLAASTEIMFLLCVARNFISADPNYVRLQILRALASDSA